MKQKLIDARANYSNMFWLFMFGNVLGVILEGVGVSPGMAAGRRMLSRYGGRFV